jgi:peptidoglycan hydrolase-like protein with peptidoglycan-binding domain
MKNINTIRFCRLLIALVAIAYFISPTLIYAFSDVEEPIWLAKETTIDVSQEANDGTVIPLITNVETYEIEPDVPYSRTFIISAYYSPLPDQAKYVTGSYAGDIRLNGNGTNGADGTPVYPGMIAAPKKYAFGTKMNIPSIGTVAVHDRGGAIVSTGVRGNAYDRLDVWMGYGDIGLQRALKWGKRTVPVTVYGVDTSIKENVILEGYDPNEQIYKPSNFTQIQQVQTSLFSRQLTLGSNGEDVLKLQQILKDGGYFSGEINGIFDETTRNAVSNFQIDNKIITDKYSFGSGFVGPKTALSLMSTPVKSAHAETDVIANTEHFAMDLRIGDSGSEVIKLQEELKRVNLLGIESTGYYGEVTEHAVFKFQQIHMLAGDKSSTGAGIFGPVTRNKMNELVRARQKIEQLIERKSV